jgi:hypothetical protein
VRLRDSVGDMECEAPRLAVGRALPDADELAVALADADADPDADGEPLPELLAVVEADAWCTGVRVADATDVTLWPCVAVGSPADADAVITSDATTEPDALSSGPALEVPGAVAVTEPVMVARVV